MIATGFESGNHHADLSFHLRIGLLSLFRSQRKIYKNYDMRNDVVRWIMDSDRNGQSQCVDVCKILDGV